MKKATILLIGLLVIICLMSILILIIGDSKDKEFDNNFKSKKYLREELIEKIETNEIKIYENDNEILTEKCYIINIGSDGYFICE